MGLEIKKKWSSHLSTLSYIFGFINLLLLNIAILTKRNIFPENYSFIIILGTIIGLLSLFYNRDFKSILGLTMSLLTALSLLVIVVFSFVINTSP